MVYGKIYGSGIGSRMVAEHEENRSLNPRLTRLTLRRVQATQPCHLMHHQLLAKQGSVPEPVKSQMAKRVCSGSGKSHFEKGKIWQFSPQATPQKYHNIMAHCSRKNHAQFHRLSPRNSRLKLELTRLFTRASVSNRRQD